MRKSERKLTIEDILIVSPYNAQVNFLSARLDKGAKCGTIDKYQGQGAPISIISMTSSSVEDLPRNKIFFFKIIPYSCASTIKLKWAADNVPSRIIIILKLPTCYNY